ncbi:hypothetical protein SAMN05444851_2922 [Aliiroseovarius sediminilitoris]|uniref:DUF6998 domain-containing protein n=1 Tax=Aliiroseovarius sediminilitoris TaxID=1173584 RepID=A0A1I0QTE5_9RHOB|nr:hypothetical protein [Aliiroseovarius sediminilitoris]SEW30879.1 hypothetical protein SAMN05444851_2922 [Aliiroseovarius sediminilitoris]
MPKSTRSEIAILEEVKSLAVEYYQLTGKPLGVTGEIAEMEAARLLGLELAEARTAGFDAYRTRKDGKEKIQIKGRWKKDGTSWGRVSKINTDQEFDAVQLVLMHGNYDVFEIWEASRSDIVERLDAPGSRARNERRSMGVSQFKTIADLVWSSHAL